MDEWHTGSGIIVYDPYRADMKRRTVNWCVVNVDREITRYYREWMRREKHIHLQPPSWDAHISVVRGERISPNVQHLWKKYHNRKVMFMYKHIGGFYVTTSGLQDQQDRGLYFIVTVRCPLLVDIRKELGLKTDWNQHLTFGRIYNYTARVPKR